MEFALKALFKKMMYRQDDIDSVKNLHDLYQVSYGRELLDVLNGLWAENVALSLILDAANAAYQEVCGNA